MLVVLLVAASEEALSVFRLDLLVSGFKNLQFPRYAIAQKPLACAVAGVGGYALLRLAARHFEANFNSKSPHSFDKLDEILRTDITRPIDLTTIGMSDDPKKVHLLCWELKRTCLTAVLSCLPPGVRLSFLLTDLLGLGPDEAAELIDIKPSAYRVRLTRARKRVEDYLAPRCVHVDRANPCTCNGRLMIALDANFVSPPSNEDEIPHTAHDADGPHRDVGNLFRQLPKALLTKGDMETLLAMA
mgnify:CR=1 FL=1